MKYSPLHDAFLVSQADLKSTSYLLKYVMRRAREIAGVSLGKRKQEGPLEPIDHLEKALIEAAQDIGIDFGSDWGFEIDVSDVKG